MRFVDEMGQFYNLSLIILHFIPFFIGNLQNIQYLCPQNNECETYYHLLPGINNYADVITDNDIGAYGYNEF